MRRQSRHPFIVLLLGVLFALGLSLTVVQASAMAGAMVPASGMGSMSVHAGCDQCGEDSGVMPGGLVPTCAAPACAVPAAMISSPLPAVAIALPTGIAAQDEAMPSGRAFAPDLRPPRLPTIG